MRYQHIIWDWNGTLLDDAWLCVDIVNQMLVKRALPELSMQSYGDIFLFPVIDYYQAVGFDFSKEAFESLSDEFIAEYDQRKFECPIRPGGKQVLSRLQSQGMPQSILSASQQSGLDQMMAHFDLGDYFRTVDGVDNHHAFGKIEIGKRQIAALGVAPEEVLMIGDTVHDHHVAQAMGVDCVLVFSGHQSQERLAVTGLPVYAELSELNL